MNPNLWILLVVTILVSEFSILCHSLCTPEFVKDFLAAHNTRRAEHGAPALKSNTTIDSAANDWAAKSIHSVQLNSPTYGQNLFILTGPEGPAGAEPVAAWYAGAHDYPYYGKEANTNDGSFQNWGAFTQLVWKSSTQIGVGCAQKEDYYLVVAFYDPSGNYEGEFKANVQAI